MLGLIFERFLLVAIGALSAVNGLSFSYEGEDGPSSWGQRYSTCVGKYQSPIDIHLKYVESVKLPSLNFNNFGSVPVASMLENNGHTVVLTEDMDSLPEINGGPLFSTYRFNSGHFHWGENDFEGSESRIDNASFPLEMHLVFFNTNYDNYTNALLHTDGLTVISQLFGFGDEANEAYEKIFKYFDKVQQHENKTQLRDPVVLDELLTGERQTYFTYDGSLTTPPCSEIVTWIEFKAPVRISHDQLAMFRKIRGDNGKEIRHNIRPIQPTRSRLIRLANYSSVLKVQHSPALIVFTLLWAWIVKI